VPVGGSNEFIAFRATLTNSLRLLQKRLSDIPGLKYSIPATYNLFPNTLYNSCIRSKNERVGVRRQIVSELRKKDDIQ
jgi:hypothetical protein